MCGIRTEVGMVLGLTGDRKAVCRFAVLALLATSLSGCSAVPGWVDPSTWFGPDMSSAQSNNGQTPDLADIPARPNAGSSPQERRAVAHALVAARQQVQYSAQQLRGDTLPAAPPPGGSQTATPSSGSSTTASASEGAVSASQMPPAEPAAAAQPAAAPFPQTTGASSASESHSAAAMPAVPPAQTAGFAPSKAPPLAPSVANYVPPQIMSRYASNVKVGPATVVPPSAAVSSGAELPQSSLPSPTTQVQFIHGGTILTRGARKSVIAFAKAFTAQGSKGYVQVTGYGGSSHASVGTLEANFARAQARARQVADLLIKSGVPAAKILIQAHGQTPAGQTALAQIALK